MPFFRAKNGAAGLLRWRFWMSPWAARCGARSAGADHPCRRTSVIRPRRPQSGSGPSSTSMPRGPRRSRKILCSLIQSSAASSATAMRRVRAVPRRGRWDRASWSIRAG